MKQIIYLILLSVVSFTSCKKDCKTTPISQCELLDFITMKPIETSDCNCPSDRVRFGNICEPKDENAYYGYSKGCDEFLDTLKIYTPEVTFVEGNDKGINIGSGNIAYVAANLVEGKTFLYRTSTGFRYYEKPDSFYMPLFLNTAFADKYCRASASLVYLDNKKQMRLTLYYNSIEDVSQYMGSCEMILKK